MTIYALLTATIGVLLALLAYQTVRVWWWKALHGEIGRRWQQMLNVLCSDEADTISFSKTDGTKWQRKLGPKRPANEAAEWPEEIV